MTIQATGDTLCSIEPSREISAAESRPPRLNRHELACRAVARLLAVKRRPPRAVIYYDPVTGREDKPEPGERLAERYVRIPRPLTRSEWESAFAQYRGPVQQPA